jgi:hypothetical protein
MFAACEGPEGPAGPKGDQGDPGEQGEPGENVVNWEGFAEGIKCADCHNPDTETTFFVWGRKYEWILSKHAIGGDYERNTKDCASCHTTEGYVQSQTGRTVTDNVHASPPGCFACHSPHSRADFSLRTVDPVTILSAIEGVPNYTFDYGKGNLCVACHKTRSMTAPKPDPTKTATTDVITITSSRWYPHYGVQGQMLAGEGGFEFQGETYSNSSHTDAQAIKDEGCGICHMALEARNPAGGHSMWLETEEGELTVGCNLAGGCHNGGLDSLNYDGKQAIIHGLLEELATLLLEREWIFVPEGGGYSVNAGKGTGVPRQGPLKIAPAYLSGAMYNFFFVEHDLSHGGHNYDYAKKLLEDSIAKLSTE